MPPVRPIPLHWGRWSYPAFLPLLLLPAAWLFAQPGSGWKAAIPAAAFVCFAALLVWHLRSLYLSTSTLRQRNLALEDAMQLARDATGAQSDFIANVGTSCVHRSQAFSASRISPSNRIRHPVYPAGACGNRTWRGHDARSLLDAGADCALTKPVVPADLDRAIQRVQHGPKH